MNYITDEQIMTAWYACKGFGTKEFPVSFARAVLALQPSASAEPVAWIKDGELTLHKGPFLDEAGWDRLIYAPPPSLFRAFEEPEDLGEIAILFEHEDGRYAVNPDTTGDPKWHRLGPVTLPPPPVNGIGPEQEGV